MSLLEFLNTLENTLNELEVKGKKNINYLYGCFVAIEDARKSILSVPEDGGEVDGRQTDIGTDGSDNGN